MAHATINPQNQRRTKAVRKPSAARGLEARCVFLCGAPRSGTTYVQLLLYASGAFATAQETHLFTAFLGRLDEVWERFEERAAQHRNVGLPAVMSRGRFDWMLRDFALSVMSDIAAQAPNAPWVLEKTPENALHWQLIARLLPEARFITVIRDPRAVVASTIAARSWAGEWAHREVAQITETWIRTVNACLALEAERDNVTRIRFELLRAQTPGILGNLLAKYDVHASAERIAQMIESVSLESLRKNRFEAPWSLDAEPADFFRAGAADSWREELPLATIALIEQLAKEEMRALGYVPSARLTEAAGA